MGSVWSLESANCCWKAIKSQLGQTRYRFTPVAASEAPTEAATDVYTEGAGLETSAPAENQPE